MVISQVLETPKELLKSPTYLLKRIGIIAKEKSIDAFDSAPAGPFTYSVLAVLEGGACRTQSSIAEVLRYDPSYLVGVLDELEQSGLVERKRDTADRRRHVVSMTPAGAKELQRLREVRAGVDEDLLSGLNATERKTLLGLLTKALAAHDSRYEG
ncbi:MAG TPA: MarR family transcriptional regulator [Gaiellaceae bacterium]|nr:MarR family transcriptional regulator [Gaiellaceae bacterium]